MDERDAGRSPRRLARMAGAFQLLEALTAAPGEVFVPGRLFVHGDAAATAANVLGHERLFWAGFASSLVGVAFHLAWALLMYELLRPVDRRLARLAVLVIAVGCALQAVTALLYLAPLPVLVAGHSSGAFTPAQWQALAALFATLSAYAFDMYLVFFGLWCVLTGILILRSTFLPRILGVLLAIAGLGWLTYLLPGLGTRLFMPYVAAASALGEMPIMLWLLLTGVNETRWLEQAGRTGGRHRIPAGS